MARGQSAPINPALLKWARQRSRIPKERAAERLKIDVEQLLAMEAGEAPISPAKLRKCAKLYRRSLALFFLPEPPDEVEVPTDFRRLPDGSQPDTSTDLVHFVRQVRSRQAAALEIAARLGPLEKHRVPFARRSEDVAAVARRLREVLEYPLEEQMKRRQPDVVQRALRAKVEDLGVLVFTASLPVEEFRGLSLYDPHVPVIAINAKDAYAARNFSLMHEATHLMLRREGACNMADADATEVFCNAVAAECLVPEVALLGQPEVEGRTPASEWPQGDIADVARRFGVSSQVIARRLRDLGRMSQDDFVPYLHRKWKATKGSSSGGPSYYRLQKSRLGVPFISLVVEGYNRTLVSVREVHELLGVKPRKLHKLVEELR